MPFTAMHHSPLPRAVETAQLFRTCRCTQSELVDDYVPAMPDADTPRPTCRSSAGSSGTHSKRRHGRRAPVTGAPRHGTHVRTTCLKRVPELPGVRRRARPSSPRAHAWDRRPGSCPVR
ncbi:hypothetical protein [Allokutzneria oryzae]|uniref:Uncharacterized protein n=1 Tax=Allokutzneria oryzae TaxID=1378989 RepID=A0ABV6A1F2_9PSEU